nr:hypothetical protein BaRGS_026009 [Batillaria attramentaria]
MTPEHADWVLRVTIPVGEAADTDLDDVGLHMDRRDDLVTDNPAVQKVTERCLTLTLIIGQRCLTLTLIIGQRCLTLKLIIRHRCLKLTLIIGLRCLTLTLIIGHWRTNGHLHFERLPDGKWNCSVPHWADFQRHFLFISLDGNGSFTIYALDRNSTCPETHFRCPGDGYCMPVYVRCNDVYDCPGKEDEAACDSYTCPWRQFSGQDYAFGVMVVLNFVLFVLIAVGQILIYCSIQTNSMSDVDPARRSRDLAIARRLFAIVMSDFMCWFPLGLAGILASLGIPISGEINVAMAIFVLPFNSALNPFLYTFNVIVEKRRLKQEELLRQRLMAEINRKIATREERNKI